MGTESLKLMIETLFLNLVVSLLWQTIRLEVSYSQWKGQTERDHWRNWSFRPTSSWRKIHLSKDHFNYCLQSCHTRWSHYQPRLYTPPFLTCNQGNLFKVNGAKNLRDKRQITTTFAVKATWEFYPIKLIYTEKPRNVCLQNVSFPRSFHVRYTENYRSNQLKATEHFEKVILPYLDQTKENMGYSKVQMSLVIMDMFKEQVNNETRELCARNNCEIVIAPHNLTNRFQPLDFSGLRSAKTYVSEM